MLYGYLDFDGIRTDTARNRKNLVRIDTLLTPGTDPVPEWDGEKRLRPW